ncbi:MAG: ABC transporter permease subunit, partial [Pseudomonadota bacterium]
FGLASKVVMASLIVYFPVASTFYDALVRTDPAMIDLMRLSRASRRQTLWLVRIPAALPALGSGLRVSATLAPIGAVVGEWVGAAAGLGFVMIQAQARVQTDVVFAALILLVALALSLRAAADRVADRIAPWAIDTHRPQGDLR